MATKTKKPKVAPRKPPQAAIGQFVGGGSVGAAGGQTVGQGVRGGKTTRREVKTGGYAGQLEARVTVCVPEGLLMKAKVWCVENRTSLSAVFVEALRSRIGA